MDTATGQTISKTESAFETIKPGQDDPLDHYGVFEEKRQLTLTGQDYPHVTSYTDHYPPKYAPLEYPPAGDPGQPLPFNGVTTFQADYPGWPLDAGALKGGDPTKVGAPFVAGPKSSYTNDYPAHPIKPVAAFTPAPLPTYMAPAKNAPPSNFVMPPKRGPDFAPAGAPAKTPFDAASTYTRTFVGHPADKPAPAPAAAPGKTPFDGISTYTAHYVPKGLAGVPMPGGFKIPYPRENLGFMIVNSKAGHVTMPDLYKDMIFHATRLPTKATAVCTTVYDNQDTVCVLILMGNSPRGSDNLVLGQFDITNIPPQPYGQPKFEVTFSLSHDSILAVECRDLDGPRHKAWLDNGGKIVVVQGA